jgi:hypothetical protein
MAIQRNRPQAVVSQHQMQAMIPRPIVSPPQGFRKPMQMTQATVSFVFMFIDEINYRHLFNHVIFYFYFLQSLPLGVPVFKKIPQDTLKVKDNVLKMQTISPQKYRGSSYRDRRVKLVQSHYTDIRT